VGLKYRGSLAVAFVLGVCLSIALAGAALAADPPLPNDVADGVVTVSWVDAEDGPLAGASIRITWYHEGDPIPGFMPAVTTDAAGVAVISGVPRAGDGGAPVLLDVRGDLATSTVDEAGCSIFKTWLAVTPGVVSAAETSVALETELESININCPEPTPTPTPTLTPTPTPTAEPTATVEPTATPAPSGGVLGTVGTPGVTPPDTGTVGPVARGTSSGVVPALIGLILFAALVVPAAVVPFARAEVRRRR
jgi:hypothetical protein